MIRQSLSTIVAGWFLFASYSALAGTSGRLDPSFNSPAPGTPDGAVLSVVPVDNGKVLIGGAFTRIGNFSYRGIARLASGGIDLSFNPGSGADNIVNCVITQPDRKVVIGGLFRQINGSFTPKVARLNSDGSLDPSFQSNFPLTGNVNTIAIQADGSLVIGGAFSVDGHTNVVRLNLDGTIDATFSASVIGVVNSSLIQSDQRIVLAGAFTNVNGTIQNRITRLQPNGSLDLSFNAGGGVDGPIYAACLASNDSIVMGGRFSSVGGVSRNFLAALNTDGSVAEMFSSSSGPNDAVYTLWPVGDAIVAGGRFTEINGIPLQELAKFHADGSLDETFQSSANPNGGPVFSLAATTSTNIFVGGSFTEIGGESLAYIARISGQGEFDPAFNPGKGITSDIYSIIPLSNGEILIGGGFRNINGHGQSGLAKLQSNGSLDETFAPRLTNTFVAAAAMQSSGDIVIGGVISTNGATNSIRLARIHEDGSFDTAFSTGTGLDARVQALATQADDRILVIGSFQHYNNAAARGIARLNADGTLDTSFNSGTGPDNNINALAIQPDGRIVIGGDFTKYNSLSRPRITRLNINGSIDASFNPLAKTDFGVAAILIQSDGKIVIGGDFQTVDGFKRHQIARLLSDGTLDTSFDPGTGPNTHVATMVEQPDGKIVIGGFFTAVDEQPLNYFARLLSNGGLDVTFETGAGADSFVYALALQQDNQLLIAGSFGNIDGQPRSHIARVFNVLSGPAIEVMPAQSFGSLNLVLQPDARLQGTVETSEDLLTWIRQSQLQVPPGTNSIETAVNIDGRQRFYRVIFE